MYVAYSIQPIAWSCSTWAATPSPAPRPNCASPTASEGSTSARVPADGRGNPRVPDPGLRAGRHLRAVRRRPDADLWRPRYRQRGARRVPGGRRLRALCRHGRAWPPTRRGTGAGDGRRVRAGARRLSAADRAAPETIGTPRARAPLPGADAGPLGADAELAAGRSRRRISQG